MPALIKKLRGEKMKFEKGMQALSLLLVMALIGAIFVPVVSAEERSVDLTSKVTIVDSPKIKLIENSRTSAIAQVGDVLITLKSNPEHSESTMVIEDLKTKEKQILDFKTTYDSGKYTTEVYIDGKETQTFVTEYDPFEPGITGQLIADKGTSEKTDSDAFTRASHYYWDDVYFATGYGIKYPHPDYQAYGAQAWDSFYISGDQLYHRHMSDSESQVTAQMAPILAGTAIGLYLGSGVGAIIGTALGIILSGSTSAVLLDEEGCIWFWESKEWGLTIIPVPPYIQNVPKYFRIASYTLWDGINLGNP